MGVRDNEIKRLINYGKAMGVEVAIYNKNVTGNAAEWVIDGSRISVYAGPGTSKTDTILSLIHELAHHKWFINEKNRQIDLKFEEALGRENFTQENPKTPTPKHLRKKIYDVELAGTKYWEEIYKDTDIKIPIWKVNAAMEFDMYMYERYYETGFFPKTKEKKEQNRKINNKWKP